MQEPITSVPWHCGFLGECKVGWHLSTYWIDTTNSETGYSFDEFTDGDHDDCEEDDLPTAEDEAAAWEQYHRACAESGDDPLGQLSGIRHLIRRLERWQVEFQISIVGLVLRRVRRRSRGPWLNPSDDAVPAELREFLLVEPVGAIWALRDDAIKTTDAVAACPEFAAQRHKAGAARVKGLVSVEVLRPRPGSAIARDIKRAARRAAGRS
jgi:hypothetical protein